MKPTVVSVWSRLTSKSLLAYTSTLSFRPLFKSTSKELNEASRVMFEKISSGKVKIKIFKKYKLDDVLHAHQDLEGRKILGPAVLIPN